MSSAGKLDAPQSPSPQPPRVENNPTRRTPALFNPGAVWVEDHEVSCCSAPRCQARFGLLVGRHHCRWCGGVFCDRCVRLRRRRHGANHRCCVACTLPVIFHAHKNPATGGLQAEPMWCILSYLAPKDVTALMLTCKTMLSTFPVPAVPYYPSIQSRFPSFYSGAEVGNGAFGVVYMCRDRLNPENGYVAIKRFEKARITSYTMWGKVMTEAAVLRTVHHPSIARVMDALQTKEDLFIVMEAGRGGTLRQAVAHLRQYGLPVEPFAANVLRQVGDALMYLYEVHNIVHRDIKPENIVVSDDFTKVMLIDFGLAEHVNKFCLVSFLAAGTPGYASPENIRSAVTGSGPAFHASGMTMHKADIFSLGATVYFLLSQRRALRSRGFTEQYAEVAAGIRCEGDGWTAVSPAAKALVSRMLSLNAADRPDGSQLAHEAFVLDHLDAMKMITAHRHMIQEQENERESVEWVMVAEPSPPSSTAVIPPIASALCAPRKGLLSNVYDFVLPRVGWS